MGGGQRGFSGFGAGGGGVGGGEGERAGARVASRGDRRGSAQKLSAARPARLLELVAAEATSSRLDLVCESNTDRGRACRDTVMGDSETEIYLQLKTNSLFEFVVFQPKNIC